MVFYICQHKDCIYRHEISVSQVIFTAFLRNKFTTFLHQVKHKNQQIIKKVNFYLKMYTITNPLSKFVPRLSTNI